MEWRVTPSVQVPGPQAVLSNAALTFSTANGNMISVGDPTPVAVDTVNLQDFWGTLHVSNTVGLTALSGNDSALVSFSGPLTALNAALDGLRYTPPDFTYSHNDTLSVQLQTASATEAGAVAISVTHANMPPAVTVSPNSQAISSDVVTFLSNQSDIVIADPDANDGVETLLVQASMGAVKVGAHPGVTAVGQDSALLELTGTLQALNDTIQGLVYIPHALFSGSAVVSFLINDNGNSGVGGPLTGSAALGLTLTTSNIPPVVDGPSDQACGSAGITFAAANGNPITVKDPDSGGNSELVSIQESVGNGVAGTLTVANTAGLVVTGNGTHLLGLYGPISAINAGLDGLSYHPAAGVTADLLQVRIEDKGYTGGVDKAANLFISLAIDFGQAIPPPAIDHAVNQDFIGSGATFSSANGNPIRVVDGYTGSAQATVWLQVLHGTLTVAGDSTGVAGNGTGLLQLTGTLAAVNAHLDGLHFTPATNDADDFLSILATFGNLSTSDGLGLTFDSANTLAPVLDAPGPQSLDTGNEFTFTPASSTLIFSETNGNGFHVAAGDANGAIESLSIFVTHGRLRMGDTGGLMSIDAGGGQIIAYGTIAALNAALDGLEYAPDLGFGFDTLAISFGNNGSAPPSPNAGGNARFAVAYVPIAITGASAPE